MDQIEFFRTVITSSSSGKLLICSRNHVTPWHEEYYNWPGQALLISQRVNTLKEKHDVYFSPHLFSTEASTKSSVIITRTIQADLDAATDYPFEPTVLVETSPSRYQGYWLLKENYEVETVELERLAKRLTYNILNADHTGWPLGKRLRIPGTLNFKYNTGPHEVNVIANSGKLYTPEDFELLPAVPANVLAIQDNDFLDVVDNINLGGPLELLQTLKDKIPHGVYYDYINKVTAEDRSAALWSLMCTLFEAGLTREQVFWLAKYSPNNKFAGDLRYNANRELAKAVQEAEKKVKIKRVDVISAIDIVRNMATPNIPGGALMKRRQIYFAVKLAMDATGRFVRVVAGLPYFIPKDTGRPIALTPGSEHLRALLHLRYGINSADPEYKYVHDGVIDEGVTLDKEIQESTFSFFDGHSLYVHTGKKDVIRVTPDRFEIVENASDDILFPWHDIFEPFQFDPKLSYDGDWADAIFGDLHNTTNMSPAAAKALLKSWLIFTLFRSLISTRPILAFFGPPGSSKSTIPHRIYALFYSRRLAVSGISGAGDFDMSSAKLPILCIDNLDSYVSWIVDKLAQAIGNIDILKRKLFTDVDTIRHRRQAMIVVTAHNPKFTREDVTSRLLLITLDEIKKTRLVDETSYINHIVTNRAKLWASILKDVQKVLQTPKASTSTVKWRIQDFAAIGEWIAIALGHQQEFNEGLSALLTTQADTIIQQEELLSQALRTISPDKALTSNELWNELLVRVGANQSSFIHTYKNPIRLAQKLITMKPSLSRIVEITQIQDEESRQKKWIIRPISASELTEGFDS